MSYRCRGHVHSNTCHVTDCSSDRDLHPLAWHCSLLRRTVACVLYTLKGSFTSWFCTSLEPVWDFISSMEGQNVNPGAGFSCSLTAMSREANLDACRNTSESSRPGPFLESKTLHACERPSELLSLLINTNDQGNRPGIGPDRHFALFVELLKSRVGSTEAQNIDVKGPLHRIWNTGVFVTFNNCVNFQLANCSFALALD